VVAAEEEGEEEDSAAPVVAGSSEEDAVRWCRARRSSRPLHWLEARKLLVRMAGPQQRAVMLSQPPRGEREEKEDVEEPLR
jgi:hypothetical protein